MEQPGGCLFCHGASSADLCDRHARAVEATEVTAEQLRSRVVAPAATLIGPCGAVLAVADGSIIGRDPAHCDVAVLHASVSVLHARLSRIGEAWTILDLGSRNGTDVDGVPAVPRAALAAGARVRIGEVVFLFWPAPVERRRRRARRSTQPLLEPAALRVQVATTGQVIELVRRDDGGLVRGPGRAVTLTGLEFRLLQLLAVRRHAATDPELAYAPSTEIAESLGFRSIDADTDNVRELVHRVRRKLVAAGIGDPVKSRRGVGYRLHGDLLTPTVRLAA